MNIYYAIGISALLFSVYWCLVFALVDKILETSRTKKVYHILASAINTVIIFTMFVVTKSTLGTVFFLLLIMLIEFTILYQERIAKTLFCTLACILHVLVVLIITTGVFAMTTDIAVYKILEEKDLLIILVATSLMILNIAIVIVTKVIPLHQVKIINQKKEQLWFMNAWMIVNCIYLNYNITIFKEVAYPEYLVGNQVVAAITVLIGLYIVLFFSIKTSAMLGYKEENEKLERAVYQEQQYRDSMTKDAIANYEINFTKDIVTKGMEDIAVEMPDVVYRYTDMLNFMSRKYIYSEDIEKLIRSASRTAILREFENGNNQIIVEYRMRLENGKYSWVRATTSLVQDREHKDVIGFTCIRDIDVEKKRQLELQHKAERDPLTGLYNKSMTKKLIDEYLVYENRGGNAAFFMVDVDNFKAINDHLGHIYGDAVLCELADKLSKIFRSNDIVGRIGGDEYIVFLRGGVTSKKAEEKAEEICKSFHISYKGNDGEEYTISSSIGLSFFPKDGSSFQELYSHADAALYTAKSDGKNNYKIYDGSNFVGYSSQRTEVQKIETTLQKGFRENRIEYVFKMLYHSENAVAAIHSALELVTNHFSFERGYIFETSKDGQRTSNTFEWCANGVTPQIDNLQNLPIEAVATANKNFYKNGMFILKSLDDLEPIEREVLEPQGIKSMFQFGIFDKNNLLGFIGFDNCRNETIPNDYEIDEMETICNILSTFFVKQYIDDVSSKDLEARQEVMNHLDNFIYVVTLDTFEVLFMNKKTQELIKHEEEKIVCYQFFRGSEKQCMDCPIRKMQEEHTNRAVSEMYNEVIGVWIEAVASTLQWTDGSLVALLNCMDITKQKAEHQSHIHELEQLAYVDELTGGRTYHKFKEDAVKILAKQGGSTHLLVKVDLNNFKLINQIYGYEVGNEILCYMSNAFALTSRDENEIFARISNDEFVGLFRVKDKEEIEELYRQFLDSFYQQLEEKYSFQCSFSHGRYICYPSSDGKFDISDMYEKVNIAHKAAKVSQAQEFILYDEQMTKDAIRRKDIENSMMQALEDKEFVIYLQPKYNLDSETIGGAEALTRWKKQNGKLVPPNTFIPVFEENGFIINLDLYVFRTVCETIRKWIEEGLKPVTISVNFSRLHMEDEGFVQTLCEITDEMGIPRDYLEIEVTETVIYENIELLERVLNDLHAKGFSMSMDDFGSGYSSLGMLKNLPVDVIKMDRSFFVNQKDRKRSKAVVKSIIEMAKGLGIHIVAEGVEKQEHIDFLRELHCDMVQGYYYAKPMPISAFEQRLYTQNF